VQRKRGLHELYFDAKDTTGLQAVATPIVPIPIVPANGSDVDAPVLSG